MLLSLARLGRRVGSTPSVGRSTEVCLVSRSHAPVGWRANTTAVVKDMAWRRRAMEAPALKSDAELVAEFVRAKRVKVIPRGVSGFSLPKLVEHEKRGGRHKDR